MAVSTLAELEIVARGGTPPSSTRDERTRIARGRATVEHLVASGEPVYGLTTGFGSLASVRIDPSDARDLQRNLVRSHAVGVGEPLAHDTVRGMLFLLSQSLRRGTGRARRARRAAPCAARARRSARHPLEWLAGSSGDLAPLAHLALC